MSANVRCAGRSAGVTYVDSYDRLSRAACGWKGYRKPHPGYGIPTKTLPCPNCGGKVEPIPRNGTP